MVVAVSAWHISPCVPMVAYSITCVCCISQIKAWKWVVRNGSEATCQCINFARGGETFTAPGNPSPKQYSIGYGWLIWLNNDEWLIGHYRMEHCWSYHCQSCLMHVCCECLIEWVEQGVTHTWATGLEEICLSTAVVSAVLLGMIRSSLFYMCWAAATNIVLPAAVPVWDPQTANPVLWFDGGHRTWT